MVYHAEARIMAITAIILIVGIKENVHFIDPANIKTNLIKQNVDKF